MYTQIYFCRSSRDPIIGNSINGCRPWVRKRVSRKACEEIHTFSETRDGRGSNDTIQGFFGVFFFDINALFFAETNGDFEMLGTEFNVL